jgi:hypothetical protein
MHKGNVTPGQFSVAGWSFVRLRNKEDGDFLFDKYFDKGFCLDCQFSIASES